jgi:hypothetical protein
MSHGEGRAMSDAGKAVREYQAELARTRRKEEFEKVKWLRSAKRLRLAWAEGHNTLYKFKSLNGDSCHQVLDIIENSRIYFSAADQLNDPLDCAPVLKLAKDLKDPEFVAELRADEARLIAESGLPADDVARRAAEFGVDVRELAAGAMKQTRQALVDEVRVFCLSAREDHPLLWSHYAASHTGVCLHFRCTHGTLFGSARGVDYVRRRLPILIPLKYNKTEDDIADAMVRRKATFWRYENEYRIIGHTNADWGYKFEGRFCTFDPALLCGITLGMKLSATDRSVVMRWIGNRYPAIPVYQAAEDEDSYGMHITRIW